LLEAIALYLNSEEEGGRGSTDMGKGVQGEKDSENGGTEEAL
jgi:hypothetical protein